jgi:hypothetical protein
MIIEVFVTQKTISKEKISGVQSKKKMISGQIM